MFFNRKSFDDLTALMKSSRASGRASHAPFATASQWSLIPPHRLFPSLAAATAVLMFLGIIAPAAHAQQLVTYFNFNDSNEISDSPGIQTSTITQSNLTPSFVAGSSVNQYPTDLTGAGQALRLTFPNNGGGNPKTFQFTVSTVGLTNLSLTYATRTSVAVTQTLSYSTNGGTTFTSTGSQSFTPSSTTFSPASFTISTGADNQASVIFRITILSAATNHREFNDFDNIQLTGNAVPEPATVGAGLLGAFALCWHQRRRFSAARHLFRLSSKPAAV